MYDKMFHTEAFKTKTLTFVKTLLSIHIQIMQTKSEFFILKDMENVE